MSYSKILYKIICYHFIIIIIKQLFGGNTFTQFYFQNCNFTIPEFISAPNVVPPLSEDGDTADNSEGNFIFILIPLFGEIILRDLVGRFK